MSDLISILQNGVSSVLNEKLPERLKNIFRSTDRHINENADSSKLLESASKSIENRFAVTDTILSTVKANLKGEIDEISHSKEKMSLDFALKFFKTALKTLTFCVASAIQTVLRILNGSKSFLTSTLFSLPVPVLAKIALPFAIDLVNKAMNYLFPKIGMLNEKINLDDLLNKETTPGDFSNEGTSNQKANN